MLKLQLLLSFLYALQLSAQQDGQRQISFYANLNDSTEIDDGPSADLEISVLKFYISKIGFWNDEMLVFQDSTHHLVEIGESPTPLSVNLEKVDTYNKITFVLGVDSLTSSRGVGGGDLDPTRGMYWTWKSGYINFKLEGSSPESPARKQQFQMHVGGYQAPYSSLRIIEFPVIPVEEHLIYFNLEKLMKNIDLAIDHHVMSPGEKSVRIADLVAESFEIIN